MSIIHCISSGLHVRVIYTPYNPLLYSKFGICRGIPIFLIFDPKIYSGSKDQEKAQSEKDSHSKTRGGKKLN